MNRAVRLLHAARKAAAAVDLIDAQRDMIAAQQDVIRETERALQLAHLNHTRELQAMACAWLIHIENPQFDLRQDLAAMDVELGHRIAVLEEHIV